jgi:hypothetical protein
MENTMEKKHRKANQDYFKGLDDERLVGEVDCLNREAMTATSDEILGNLTIIMADLLHEVVIRGLTVNRPYIFQ